MGAQSHSSSLGRDTGVSWFTGRGLPLDWARMRGTTKGRPPSGHRVRASEVSVWTWPGVRPRSGGRAARCDPLRHCQPLALPTLPWTISVTVTRLPLSVVGIRLERWGGGWGFQLRFPHKGISCLLPEPTTPQTRPARLRFTNPLIPMCPVSCRARGDPVTGVRPAGETDVLGNEL